MRAGSGCAVVSCLFCHGSEGDPSPLGIKSSWESLWFFRCHKGQFWGEIRGPWVLGMLFGYKSSVISGYWVAACVNPPPHPILCPRWEVKGPVGIMWAPRIPGRACSSPHLPRNAHAAGCCGSQPRPPACTPMLAPAYLPAALPLQPAWSVYTASQSTCSLPAHPVPWFPGNSMTVKAPLD